MIDLVALRSLVAVSRQGSVVAAAAALGYTPSAVSQQVKKLEASAGVPLLEKFGRGVMLTEPGRVLVERGAVLLDQMEQVETVLEASAGVVAGSLRLSSFSTAVRGLVAPALQRLAGSAPDLQVHLTEHDPWESVDLVATGQVDLAVVHNWEPVALRLPPHVESRVLGTDRADVLVHESDPLAARRQVTPRALVGQRWVSVSPGSICHEWLTRMFEDIGTQPRIDHFSAEFAGHVALVERGVATALVPRLGRGPLPHGVVAIPVRDPVPTRVVTALWRQTMTASPAIGHVVDVLAQVARAERCLG